MNPTLAREVEELISRQSGRRSQVRSLSPVCGGSINRARLIELEDGRRFFLKSNDLENPQMFAREVEGLYSLAATETIRVPEVIGFGKTDSETYLVLEHIRAGRRPEGFFEVFGRQLAELHSQRQGEGIGFQKDNFIGSTVQPNPWSADWIQFWSQHRIGHQLKLAANKGLGGKRLSVQGEKLRVRLPQLLATRESVPTLLHGDLWSGNFMCDTQGRPVLIDPAAYYGHHEAEFGMTTLFGGFDDAFYSAYNQVRPFEEGSTARIAIYRLYHLLNHVNLFGSSYLDGCFEILDRYTT